MKRALLTLIATMLIGGIFAQVSFKTGDSKFDAELNVTNNEAKSDLTSFKKELTSSYKITTSKIDNLLKIMEPAEVLLSCKIGEIANRTIDEVVSSYKVNKDKGWGAIAKDMGIKPGSPEFHALKGKTKKAKGNSGSSNKSSGGKTSKPKSVGKPSGTSGNPSGTTQPDDRKDEPFRSGGKSKSSGKGGK